MKSIEELIFQLLARSWFWRMLFFYSNSNLKSIEELIFSAFGKILVLANAFFSIQILIKKVLKNCFFQLLARFGFWRMLFFYSNSH